MFIFILLQGITGVAIFRMIGGEVVMMIHIPVLDSIIRFTFTPPRITHDNNEVVVATVIIIIIMITMVIIVVVIVVIIIIVVFLTS